MFQRKNAIFIRTDSIRLPQVPAVLPRQLKHFQVPVTCPEDSYWKNYRSCTSLRELLLRCWLQL